MLIVYTPCVVFNDDTKYFCIVFFFFLKKPLVASLLVTYLMMASSFDTVLLLLLVIVSIGHCSNVPIGLGFIDTYHTDTAVSNAAVVMVYFISLSFVIYIGSNVFSRQLNDGIQSHNTTQSPHSQSTTQHIHASCCSFTVACATILHSFMDVNITNTMAMVVIFMPQPLKPIHWLYILSHKVFFNTTTLTPLKEVTPQYGIYITDGIPRNFAPIEIEFEFESQNTTDLTSMAFSWRIPQQRHETSKHTLRHHLDHKKHHYSRANLRKIATTTHRTLSFNSNASFGTVFSVRYLCTFGLYSLLMCLTFLLLFYCDCVVFFFVLFCYFYISITFLSLLLLVLLSLIYDHTWRVYKYDTPHYRYYLNLFHLLLFHLLMLFCIYFICLYLNVSSSLCHARVYIISTFCILYITVVFWSNNILAKEPDDTKCVPSLHCIQRKANPAFWICQTGSYITYLMNMEMAKVVHTQLRKDLKFLQ
eukprot:1016393_1